MKFIAIVAVIVLTVLIACSSETATPPTQPVPTARPAATTASTEAPVEQATTAAIAPTAAEPTEAPTAKAPPAPTAEPTMPPTDVTQSPTATPVPTPTAIQTTEINLLKTTAAEIPTDLPDYDRDDWKHWVDADGDCQDARPEVLVAESQTTVSYRTDRECRVTAGQWLAPYTGTVVTDPGKLDVNHMVPLGNAHASGASRWSPEHREQYANHLDDPQHLIAVTASANRSKGARGPQDWKPDDRSYWCQYAVDWITIKDTWDLTATGAEFAALEEMLTTCDVQHQLGAVFSMKKPDLPSFGGSTPRPTSTPIGESPATQYASCDAAQAAGEARVQGSKGGGRGFLKWMVPSARDGDGDGVVCER